LFLFLCLTHFEECIYFLCLIIGYIPIFLLVIKTQTPQSLVNEGSYNEFPSSSSKKDKKKLFSHTLRNKLFLSGFLLLTLCIIFYLATQFFGYLAHYFNLSLGKLEIMLFLLKILNSKLVMITIISFIVRF